VEKTDRKTGRGETEIVIVVHRRSIMMPVGRRCYRRRISHRQPPRLLCLGIAVDHVAKVDETRCLDALQDRIDHAHVLCVCLIYSGCVCVCVCVCVCFSVCGCASTQTFLLIHSPIYILNVSMVRSSGHTAASAPPPRAPGLARKQECEAIYQVLTIRLQSGQRE